MKEINKEEIKKEQELTVERVQMPIDFKDYYKIPSGEYLDYHDYLVWIGNMLVQIKKATVGSI